MAQKEYGRAFLEHGHMGVSLLHLQYIVNLTIADAKEHGLRLEDIRFRMVEEALGVEHPLPATQIYWRAVKEED